MSGHDRQAVADAVSLLAAARAHGADAWLDLHARKVCFVGGILPPALLAALQDCAEDVLRLVLLEHAMEAS